MFKFTIETFNNELSKINEEKGVIHAFLPCLLNKKTNKIVTGRKSDKISIAIYFGVENNKTIKFKKSFKVKEKLADGSLLIDNIVFRQTKEKDFSYIMISDFSVSNLYITDADLGDLLFENETVRQAFDKIVEKKHYIKI